MIDLHTHTTYSDGTYSVRELLIEAEKGGLTALSITDHNSVDAYKELEVEEIRDLFSGKIIPGCEITTTYNGEIIEVLAYNFDLTRMEKLLSENVLGFKEKQQREFDLIKRRFEQIGVRFNMENIVFDSEKNSSRKAFHNEIVKYTENRFFFT